MRRNDSRTFPHLTLSLLTHAALAGLVTISPALVPLPEGTVSSMEVEFTALTPPPLGQQLKTLDVGEHESEAPAQPTVTHPKAVEITPPTDPDPITVTPPPAKKNKLITNAKSETKSDKKLQISPPEAKSAETTSVTTTASPVEVQKTEALPIKKINTSIAEASDQDFLKEDLAEIDNNDEIGNKTDTVDNDEDIDNEIESELYALKDSAITTDKVAQAEPEKIVSKPSEKIERTKPAPPALTEGLPQKSEQLRHESNMNYGVPSGVRDYRELVQIPGNVPPQYPELSRRKGEMGQVKLMYFVTSTGIVSSMKLTQSSGHEALDYEAIRAISKYKYQPGQQGYTSHTVNFMLRGDMKAAGGTLRTSSNYKKSLNPNN